MRIHPKRSHRLISTNKQPCIANAYWRQHTELLLNSYYSIFRQPLIPCQKSRLADARSMYEFQYPVLSHTYEREPKINYANLRAQEMFEADWDTLIGMSSSQSTENQTALAQRRRALAEVMRTGCIRHYQGERVTLKGKHFQIEDAALWNLFDQHGYCCGQAAVIFRYRIL